jgi:hypothetical protein
MHSCMFGVLISQQTRWSSPDTQALHSAPADVGDVDSRELAMHGRVCGMDVDISSPLVCSV